MEKKMFDEIRKVLVTTAHRGVFFGTFLEEKDSGKTIILTNARCAIRFGTIGGFLELADTGPTSKSLIGNPAEKITLYDVTSITEVTEEAAKRWEEWKNQ